MPLPSEIVEAPRPRMKEAIEVYLGAAPDRAPGPSYVEVRTIEV
jgi:hypothetical protein